MAGLALDKSLISDGAVRLVVDQDKDLARDSPLDSSQANGSTNGSLTPQNLANHTHPSCSTANGRLSSTSSEWRSDSLACSLELRPITAAAVAAQLSTAGQRKIPTIGSAYSSGDSSEAAEAGPQGSLFESYEGSKFRLKLGGLVSSAQPFSSPGSGRVSGCSTPLSFSVRSEPLEYPCLNFVQAGTPNLVGGLVEDDEKMTIVCHYNPVMDEYVSLSEERPCSRFGYAESEMDVLFDLYKTDPPDEAGHREDTINMGKFLAEIEKMGIRRTDGRLKEFMRSVNLLLAEDDENFLKSCDFLELNRETFLRILEPNFEIISRALKSQMIIPEFPDFCSTVQEIFLECKDIREGKVASYIPQLAKYDPNYWAVSVCTVDGQRFSLGDTEVPFSMQSCSKPFTYAICLNELGSERVHEYVGQEPSGRMFNELSLDFNNKPHNPLLNSGAIMSSALLLKLVEPRMEMSEKFDLVWKYFSKIAGEEHIGFNNSIFLSERETADRNFALAYYMRENNCFPPDLPLQDCLDFYFQICSMEVTCESLAIMGATLANSGTCPTTQQEVLGSSVVRDVLSLMHSCGMYNYSGHFAFKVGLPAKSGVSGALVLVVPGLMGIGLWSPALDSLGNTVRGVHFSEKLVEHFNFHRFDNVVQLSNKTDPRKHRYEVEKQLVTSLLYSATTGDLTALRRFKMQGCHMSETDYDGRSALHLAAAEGHIECVKLLVEECGISPASTDRWGFSPLVEARRFGHEKVVTYLLRYIQSSLPADLETALTAIENLKLK